MNARCAPWLLAGLLLSPQAPLRAQQQDTPAAAPAPKEQVDRAQALLRAHAERCKGAKVVVADYVQRRTTALVKEPLVSKGQFLFVREPAAVLFFAQEPRASTVRLTEKTYEVHRPQKQQLERFFLDGPELARGLFAVVGGDSERLLRDFVVTACTDGPAAASGPTGSGPTGSGPTGSGPTGTSPTGSGATGSSSTGSGTIVARLVANDAAVRERVQELVVMFDAKDKALAGVGYRDHSGDLVEIELRALRLDPKDAPSATLEVPKGTAVVEHRAEPPKAK